MIRTIHLWVSMALALVLHAQSPTIRGYQYWFDQFDQNDANAFFEAVAPATTVNLNNVPLNTESLSIGSHNVHLRLKDQASDGTVRWSSVVTRTFKKFHTGPWEIVAVRYWVGTPINEFDPLVRTKVFDTPEQQFELEDGPLDLCGYPTGNQTLKLQLKDNHGQWSSIVSRSVNVTSAGTLGLPTIAASAPNGFCPGTVVTFTATPPSGPNIALPGAYTWTVPTGPGWNHVPSTGNTIMVTIGSAGGTVEVFSTNHCGTSSTASLQVVIPTTPQQPSEITGPIQACAGETVEYAVTEVPGVTYDWDITGGWPDEGGPGNTITTTIGNTDAMITVTPTNACGVDGPERTANITVSSPPDAGEDASLVLCTNAPPYLLLNVLNGTPDLNGSWTGPFGPDTGIFIPGSSPEGEYTYTVVGNGACDDAIATVTVNVMDLVLDGITGPSTVDEPGTVLFTATPTLVDADSIVWSIPDGWSWADNDLDPYDAEAYLDSPDEAVIDTICAKAYGGGCIGDTECLVTELTVGVSQVNNEGGRYSVYPNPNNGHFIITIGGTPTNGALVVVDALGQRVHHQPLAIGNRTLQLDLDHLASGVYHIRIRSGSDMLNIPVMIQR